MGTVETSFKSGVDAVYAKLSDPEFLRRRCEAAGQRNVQVKADQRGDVLEIRIERDIESEIPAIAKKFVDAVNHVVDIVEYRTKGDTKVGTFRVSVNKRISLSGTINLRPTSTGCRQIETFNAKVDVPIIGGKIADLVEKQTAVGIRADHAFTARALES